MSPLFAQDTNLFLHLWLTSNISCNTSTTRLIAILRVRVFTYIPGSLQFRTSRFLKFTELSQEWKYFSRSFNGQECQNFSTTRTGLLTIPHDVQGVEGKKKQLSHSVSAEKEKHTKNTKALFWGKSRQLFADFAFHRALLNLNPDVSDGWVYFKSSVTNVSFSVLS